LIDFRLPFLFTSTGVQLNNYSGVQLSTSTNTKTITGRVEIVHGLTFLNGKLVTNPNTITSVIQQTVINPTQNALYGPSNLNQALNQGHESALVTDISGHVVGVKYQNTGTGVTFVSPTWSGLFVDTRTNTQNWSNPIYTTSYSSTFSTTINGSTQTITFTYSGLGSFSSITLPQINFPSITMPNINLSGLGSSLGSSLNPFSGLGTWLKKYGLYLGVGVLVALGLIAWSMHPSITVKSK
jgi:hypothetical protein